MRHADLLVKLTLAESLFLLVCVLAIACSVLLLCWAAGKLGDMAVAWLKEKENEWRRSQG